MKPRFDAASPSDLVRSPKPVRSLSETCLGGLPRPQGRNPLPSLAAAEPSRQRHRVRWVVRTMSEGCSKRVVTDNGQHIGVWGLSETRWGAPAAALGGGLG